MPFAQRRAEGGISPEIRSLLYYACNNTPIFY